MLALQFAECAYLFLQLALLFAQRYHLPIYFHLLLLHLLLLCFVALDLIEERLPICVVLLQSLLGSVVVLRRQGCQVGGALAHFYLGGGLLMWRLRGSLVAL